MTNGVFDPAHDAPRISTPGNPWIEETDMMDTVALLLNGFAKRCTKCRRPARMKHLSNGLCPDCIKVA
jgi:hypothetical protein